MVFNDLIQEVQISNKTVTADCVFCRHLLSETKLLATLPSDVDPRFLIEINPGDVTNKKKYDLEVVLDEKKKIVECKKYPLVLRTYETSQVKVGTVFVNAKLNRVVGFCFNKDFRVDYRIKRTLLMDIQDELSWEDNFAVFNSDMTIVKNINQSQGMKTPEDEIKTYIYSGINP